MTDTYLVMKNEMNLSSFSNSPSTRTAGISTSTTTLWYIGRGDLVRVVAIMDNVLQYEFVVSPARARKSYHDMLKRDGCREQFQPIPSKSREEVEKMIGEMKVVENFKSHWVD
jgi:hypothetical protein